MESAIRSWTLPILGIAVFAITTGFLVYNPNLSVQKNNSTRAVPIASITPSVGNTTLSFGKESFSLKAKASSQAQVLIDTAGDKVVGAEVHFTFDPKVIKITDITPGDFFSSSTVLLKTVDNDTGKATFVLGSFTPKAGQGALVNLKVSAFGKGSVTIDLNGSKVTSIEKKGNLVKEFGQTTIKVN